MSEMKIFNSAGEMIDITTAGAAEVMLLRELLSKVNDIAYWSGRHDDVMDSNLTEIAELTKPWKT